MALGFPRCPLCLLSAAQDHAARRRLAPVGEVFKAGLSGQFGAVEVAKLPQKARGSRPNGEALEVGKPSLKLRDAEKIARKAVS